MGAIRVPEEPLALGNGYGCEAQQPDSSARRLEELMQPEIDGAVP